MAEAPLTTLTAIGTFCSDSVRRRAVTTTSPTEEGAVAEVLPFAGVVSVESGRGGADEPEGWAAACPAAERTTNATIPPGRSRSARATIFPPSQVAAWDIPLIRTLA